MMDSIASDPLEEIINELNRVVHIATRRQRIELSPGETETVLEHLQELKSLRKLVFGDATIVGDAKNLETAAATSDQKLLQEFSATGQPSLVLQILLSKIQSLVHVRRECAALKKELREIYKSLDSITLPEWVVESIPTSAELAEKHPTLALVEELRFATRYLVSIFTEHEDRWNAKAGWEAADLRSGIRWLLEKQEDENWTKEQIVEDLKRELTFEQGPRVESEILIEELTRRSQERAKHLEASIREALACENIPAVRVILERAIEPKQQATK